MNKAIIQSLIYCVLFISILSAFFMLLLLTTCIFCWSEHTKAVLALPDVSYLLRLRSPVSLIFPHKNVLIFSTRYPVRRFPSETRRNLCAFIAAVLSIASSSLMKRADENS